MTIWSNAAHVFIEVHGNGFWGTTQTNYRHEPEWIDTLPNRRFVATRPSGL